jgi:hypothetical protein
MEHSIRQIMSSDENVLVITKTQPERKCGSISGNKLHPVPLPAPHRRGRHQVPFFTRIDEVKCFIIARITGLKSAKAPI